MPDFRVIHFRAKDQGCLALILAGSTRDVPRSRMNEQVSRGLWRLGRGFQFEAREYEEES
jgi:hypothetical protein